ncbi:hypothetical protein [Streptomyces sp. NPDC048445]|uniref:hypothetical protein n=1 Tax=Streptomyces sp. NPDC048445 TaxID=3365553 RepID=UPI003718A68A
MADSPGIYQWPTYFHEANSTDVLYQEEHGVLSLPIGAGVLLGNGDRYRVVDTWFSYDKHGIFDLGLHVFLVLAAGGDDRLGQLAPGYFRADPEV